MKEKIMAAIAVSLLLPGILLFTVQCRFDVYDASGTSAPLARANISHRGDFADDRVIVILNQETSMNFRSYNATDFPEIQTVRVNDVTRHAAEVVAMYREARESGNWSKLNQRADRGMLVDVNNFRRILEIRLAKNCRENVLEAIRLLNKRDDVLYAEPDFRFRMDALPYPLPTHYPYQKSVLNAINLPDAWKIHTNLRPVKVGVLDSGIDASHPDLIGRVCKDLSRDFDLEKWCVCEAEIICGTAEGMPPGLSPPFGLKDTEGHGTHIAGIIAGIGNGIIGVNPNVTLVSLRIPAAWNGAYYIYGLPVILAIDYAIGASIPILNFSAGTDWRVPPIALKQAIQNFPGLFVCSAGNMSENAEATFPAGFNLDNLITVGALNANNDGRASFSNWSPNVVEIFAPGTNILSSFPIDMCVSGNCMRGNASICIAPGYHLWSGTSMAAPFVTGVAALLMSASPEPDDLRSEAVRIRDIILNNAERRGRLAPYAAYGRVLNAAWALCSISDLDCNTFGCPTCCDGFSGGTGTRYDPFLIANARHLEIIAFRPSAAFRVINDIYITEPWNPIPEFHGSLDGNGYKIRKQNLNLGRQGSSMNYGLFRANYGAIKNLGIVAADISVLGGGNVGLFAGINRGTMTNLYVTDTNVSVFGGNNVGLFVGKNSGFFCENYGVIRNATSCDNTMISALVSISAVGGIVGYNYSGLIYRSTSRGTMLTAAEAAGGIAGRNFWGEIYWGRNFGAIYVHSSYPVNNMAGGIAGYNFGIILGYSENHGNIYYASEQSGSPNLRPEIGQIVGRHTWRWSHCAYWTGYVCSGTLQSDQAYFVRNDFMGRWYWEMIRRTNTAGQADKRIHERL